jgi:hypothetical protein
MKIGEKIKVKIRQTIKVIYESPRCISDDAAIFSISKTLDLAQVSARLKRISPKIGL